jgi:uncharacterized protein
LKSFIHNTRIDDISSNEVFSWHIREGAFERINPPWQQFKVIERKGSIQSNGTSQDKDEYWWSFPYHMAGKAF